MKAKQILCLALCLGFAGLSVQAQPGFARLTFPVSMDGNTFDNPFTGGLNNPQPSKVDLNNDGVEDLFVFDRFGNVSLTFLYTGQGDEVKYTYAPEYAINFPDMHDWVLMRDYNGDGIQDIFTHFFPPVQGITVFRGYYDAEDKIAFEPFDFCCEDYNIIYYTLANGSTTQVYVSPTDYPVVDDVDGDGDLDILTFNVAGGWVEYFQNRSLEMGYGLDSLKFKKEDNCWGKFYEASFSEEIILSSNPNMCASEFGGGIVLQTRHPGSTLVTFDADGDGDLEIVLGDVNFPKVNYLINGGDSEDAFMTEQDSNFPSYDVPVDIPVFPVPFFFDLNNDGKGDFLAAPNQLGGTPNYEVLWYYKNVNTAEEPVFELVQKDALVDAMLDFGAGSHPAFFDYNGDGLTDMLVGTDGYFEENSLSNRDPRLVLLLNTGSSTEPAFELEDEDFLGFSQYGEEAWNFAPTAGDIDQDGDVDLLVGEQDGSLYYIENLGGAGNPAIFDAIQADWMDIDVGLNSHPAIADLNRDGLPDLVIGERNGNFNYLQNVGTPSEPLFNSDHNVPPNNPILGLVSTELPGDLSAGNSAPHILDYGDSFLLVAGTQAGPVQVYSDIEDNLDGTFTLADPNYGNWKEGKRSTVAFADLNGDGFYEMLEGNYRGGLSLFSTPLEVADPVSVFVPKAIQPTRIFPNPARSEVSLEWPGDGVGSVKVRLLNIWGQERMVQTAQGTQWTIDVSGYSPGVYLLEISDRYGQYFVEKLLIH